mmetsp:Transcript_8467/g.21689  ORF Transcript_8467/g.21689 Transcript_8467/m.21689 type:complete len:259 (-) Transcript_8467:771-1547(-)
MPMPGTRAWHVATPSPSMSLLPTASGPRAVRHRTSYSLCHRRAMHSVDGGPPIATRSRVMSGRQRCLPIQGASAPSDRASHAPFPDKSRQPRRADGLSQKCAACATAAASYCTASVSCGTAATPDESHRLPIYARRTTTFLECLAVVPTRTVTAAHVNLRAKHVVAAVTGSICSMDVALPRVLLTSHRLGSISLADDASSPLGAKSGPPGAAVSSGSMFHGAASAPIGTAASASSMLVVLARSAAAVYEVNFGWVNAA